MLLLISCLPLKEIMECTSGLLLYEHTFHIFIKADKNMITLVQTKQLHLEHSQVPVAIP